MSFGARLATPRSWLLLLHVAACAPTPGVAYREAVDPATPLSVAVQRCGQSGHLADECLASLVRIHADADHDDLLAVCERVIGARWLAECHFSLAEDRARAGDRWGALQGCGRAGRYYDECLYHAWTFELQQVADKVADPIAELDAVRPVIAYWSQIETVANSPESLLWNDWWYFALTRHKPARLSNCLKLVERADAERCEAGTRNFARRSVVESLIRSSTSPDTRERVCRSGDLSALIGVAWEPEPTLDAEGEAGRVAACAEGRVERPWNPIFHPRGRGDPSSAGPGASP